MKWADAKPEQYEAMRKSVNWEGDVPKGAVFHVAGFDEQGIRVTDIWESAEDMQHFVETRLMDGARAANVEGEPVVDVFPVHAVFTPGLTKLQG